MLNKEVGTIVEGCEGGNWLLRNKLLYVVIYVRDSKYLNYKSKIKFEFKNWETKQQ